MKILVALVLFVSAVTTTCDGANILAIFPTPSYSHQQPMLVISRALAKRGHKLTVVTPNPSKTPIENHKEVNISSMYATMKNLGSTIKINAQKRTGVWKMLASLPSIITTLIKGYFKHPSVQEFMTDVQKKNTKFDLVLIESLWYSSTLGFLYVNSSRIPPVIGLSTVPNWICSDMVMGNPIDPPHTSIFSLSSYDLNFYDRIKNFATTLYLYFQIRYSIYPINQKMLVQYFGNGAPSAEEIDKNTSLLLVLSDISTNYPRPIQPNTIYIGPVHLSQIDPLPVDLQKWMDDAEDGIIYFSFGSNMRSMSMPPERRALFIEVFNRFPKMKVLWKWEAITPLPMKSENVMTSRWFPQKSILAHPKMKLFISQVGLQSKQEAIHFGVPILGIPLYADQDYNSKQLELQYASRNLDYTTFTFEDLYSSIREMLQNSTYKDNMLRLRRISLDKPMAPLRAAVWWVEYVLRHKGASHLRPVSLDLPWYQVYNIDIKAAVAVNVFLIFLLPYLFYKQVGPFTLPEEIQRMIGELQETVDHSSEEHIHITNSTEEEEDEEEEEPEQKDNFKTD